MADGEEFGGGALRKKVNGSRRANWTFGGGEKLHSNIFTLDGSRYRGVSLITGGFPCQPFSVAGKRRGAADDRAIWPQMLRVIGEARPAWVLAENVPGIINMELDRVLSDLEAIGYTTGTLVIPACAVDAKHRRDRVWIVGHAEKLQRDGGRDHTRSNRQSARTVPESGNDDRNGGKGLTGEVCQWLPEPAVGRVAHGIPRRVDRLKGLGNAIVPQVAFQILRHIRALIP